MNETQTFWTIEVKDSPNSMVDSYHLEYYPNGGGVAEVLFTDAQQAAMYATQVIENEDIEFEWQTTWLEGTHLDHFVDSSLRKKTHILIDPVYGREEEALQAIIR